MPTRAMTTLGPGALAASEASLARRGVESSERLGRYRWVVERTLAWLHRFRRLAVRYERRPDIHRAFLRLGCAVISFKFVERFC